MKNKMKYTSKFSLIIAIMLMIGCDDFVDINDDPNNPLTVPVELLLPSAQVDIVGALGMSSGGLSQITSSYTHQIVQRGTAINDYGINGGNFGVTTPWNLMYARGLMDLEAMITIAEEKDAAHYVAVGQILKAYSFSILVDVFGDVPYSQAFLGPENLNPVYDEGSAVYDEAFALLDAAIVNIASPSSLQVIGGGGDLIYNGDMNKWRRLAKTIKLKMYNQVRLVRNVSTEVNALITENDMLGSGRDADDMMIADDFEMAHGNTTQPNDRNPGWEQEYGGGNPGYYVSPFFFETMMNINTFGHRDYGDVIAGGNPLVDPRVPYYFFNQLPTGSADTDAENPCSYCPSRSGTPFLSIWQFSFNIDPNEGFDQAVSQTVLGQYPIGGAFDAGIGTGSGGIAALGTPGAPQRLLTFFARKYIEAELILSGVATTSPLTDAEVLEQAIRASFAKVNEVASLDIDVSPISGAAIDAYVTSVMTAYAAADANGKMEHIMTQKWIASFGFGVDSYTDYRRTGFPILHDGNTDDLVFTVRTRDYPNSFPWVTDNLAVNGNAPSQKIVTSADAKPFWLP